MHRKSSCMSDSWVSSRRSRRPTNLYDSQEFEKVDSLNTSLDLAKIKSVSLPQHLIARREETYFERIKNYGTNLRFNIGTFGENIWPADSKKHKAYLLGKEYETEKLEHVKKMREDFCDIIWFSYRKNFPTLNYKLIPLSESFVSDTGWGCMIRVCQMIFAQCLKRHKINKEAFADGKQNRIANQPTYELDEEKKNQINREIISWFLDTEIDANVSPYSIQNLSVYLHEKFKLKPGIWLKPSSVLFALQEIHADFGKDTAEDLQIEIYIESTIYVTQALKKVRKLENLNENSFEKFAEEFEVVEDNGEEEEENYYANGENISIQPTESQNLHQDNNNNNEHGDAVPSPVAKEEQEEVEAEADTEDVSPKVEENVQPNGDDSIESIYMNDAREIEKLLKHKWKDSLIIFILAKIGLDKPNPEYIPFIKDLMSYPESVGMIGGKPGLAYYIVGYAEDKLMYLDPHFVQESVKRKDLEENIHTYFTDTIRHVNFNDIDTSLTFGFFIKDEVTFKSFLDRFRQSCHDYESFLGVELNAPQENTTDVESVCEYEEENNNKKVRDEDGFEML